ncbi:hypothetical protein BL250_12220 [Erwinia sp. OLTSP20]|uniref:ATPase RavA stimulator ViaA n=1 Tax=unclassified Erwinia TaxID=2622719 RepID=UPI000C19F4BD|nr:MULTISPECIES: ATPase RavA stimulator ViaA [unclassified Erwinia]PIJ48317.1 hypothetical protein BV501_17575 [Erwinia sp. OAMSP11]PIJ72278.1 hypothetical protein BK416_09615 [Erwinia sp. OLSSP12]PIJ80015.1 hypothetical protein BLD46_16210 [Erwinia sp. OLMTSP26]PIJ81637.1 hypothetical protein BLD47_08185 [Erwinia sp. OLCASP19]PIJ84206.1 hypothetical protein BLD49_12530 [Erwinia sp. OLMDSP33]
MISLDTLSVFLAISENEMIEDLIATLLATPQLVAFFDTYPVLKQALLRDIPRWKTEIRDRLQTTAAPVDLAQEFALFQQNQTVNTGVFNQQLPAILSALKRYHSPFASEAASLVAMNGDRIFSNAQRTLFLQRWRLSLTLQTLTINQSLLEQEREKLLAELQQRLTMSGQLAPVLAENETSAGQLWDMSHAALQPADYQLILQYGDFLMHQPELSALAQQLGRSREAKVAQVHRTESEIFHQKVREPASVPEQVSGIHQSDDILRLLPPELATLGISELEIEFYRRLVEKRLLTYRLQGEGWRQKQIRHPAHEHHQQQQPRGPFIICVDTSGSMGGFNERCAKAFCLALLKIALSEHRRCLLMLFSHQVIVYELTADDGISQAIRFLSQRFRGGTNLAGCLEEVLNRIVSPQWQLADAVIISDFIAQRLPEKLSNKVQQHQQRLQQRFHAVAMSDHGKPGILGIFDYIWHFDTSLKSRLFRQLRR